jgi:hypothetical protein
MGATLGLTSGALGIGVLGLLLVAGLATSATWTLLGPLRLRAHADGSVVDLDVASLGNPIVEFVAADGTTVRYMDTLDGHLALGQSVPVRYDPRAPHRARVATAEATYLRPALMLLIVPVLLAATWTLVQRADRVEPADRVAAYVPLMTSLDRLGACAHGSCSATTTRRRLRAYDRARRAVAPVASPSVEAAIAELQRRLAPVRRGRGRVPAAPIAALGRTMMRDVDDVLGPGAPVGAE